ncbi:MAG: diacylglycerol/polyprenol kinase family protein [Microcoleaceae cyanobacterium]
MDTFRESPSLVLAVIGVGAWLGVILLIAEGLNRWKSVNAEVSRKIVHIGTGNVILLAWALQIPAWIGIAAGTISGIVALISYQVPILPSVNGVGRRSLGTFFYAVSIGVLVGWFWSVNHPEYAALGILVMAWGDGLAAVIGQRFGKHGYQIGGIHKSWEGSLTMLFVSFVVCILILVVVQGIVWQTWAVSGIVAMVAMGLEMFSKFGVDNLTVPIGSAALAFFLNSYYWG